MSTRSIVVAVDPGTTESAFVAFDGVRVTGHAILPNQQLADCLNELPAHTAAVVFEQIEAYGMAVGREVFETVFWTGRLFQVAGQHLGFERVTRMPRRDVKLHLCKSMKAKDPNIRVALLDRFGGESARGTKRQPGPLYGIASHEWAALAIAVTWWDTHRTVQPSESKEPHAATV
jgi:hypothetical protein